jgi:hopene-associated glycosyltransferase HpnB
VEPQDILTAIVLSSFTAWLGVLFLPWGPWRTREVLEKLPESGLQNRISGEASDLSIHDADLSDVTVVIPARDEAGVIQATLAALVDQGSGLHGILIDDRSQDGTAEVARRIAGIDLNIIAGEPLPAGWAGKLWALEQGVRKASTRWLLLLDADIQLSPGVLSALLLVAEELDLPFVSIMATLPMNRFWEKLLTPAFIYFFKMLYPFSLSNGPDRRFGSAAGGCILLERRLLDSIGSLESIRGELIDDCALAKRVKRFGFRTWTGQSRLVTSTRGYNGLREIWDMVARSAYTQLRYSPLLLLLTTLAIGVLFIGPLTGLLRADTTLRLAGLGAWLAMGASYLPTLRFYERSPLWALAMPLTGALYLAMTWTSAIRYYSGVRSVWKGRSYRRGT